jgi:HD-GYP domain-containing protein (c-di-GMP phosphodiesterase class II)
MSARPPLDPFTALPVSGPVHAGSPAESPAAVATGRTPRLLAWLAGWRSGGSVRRTVITALVGVLLLAAGSALTTRHLLSYRVHDYAILNLAGQLREMASSMAVDATQLDRSRVDAPGSRDLEAYRERLAQTVARFDRIVSAFETRNLTPDLTGLDEPVSCSWDEPSLRELRATAAVWQQLRSAVAPVLQTSASDAQILAAASAVAAQGPAVLEASRTLSGAFKGMMQRKLQTVLLVQFGVLAVAAGAGALLLLRLRQRVLRPLALAEQGAQRLIDGDVGMQLALQGDREIQAVGDALNRLSTRLRLLFEVAERTNAGLTTAELLDTLRETLRPVVAIDLIAVAVWSPSDGRGWRMHRTSGATGPRLSDGATLECGRAVAELSGALGAAAVADGFAATLTMPLQDADHEASVLLVASHDAQAFSEPVQSLLRTVAGPVRAQLDRTLSTEALVVATVEGLAKLAESRDPETGDHLVRMSAYSAFLGAELARDPDRGHGIDARYIEDLRRFAPMHDIGKVGISDSILLKPGRLTDEERADMSRHPTIGGDVLRRCEAQLQARGRSVFRVGIEIAEGHHEKWDGSGYPRGLSGQAIPLSARIVAVADVFDALTSRRPYKEAWPLERALAAIDADAGRHFDPAVVAALHRCLPQVRDFYERHKHV